jgi:hypothetical protein
MSFFGSLNGFLETSLKDQARAELSDATESPHASGKGRKAGLHEQMQK